MRVLLACLLLGAIAHADETYIPVVPLAPQGNEIVSYHLGELRFVTGLGGQTAEVGVLLQAVRADGLCARDAKGACVELRKTYEAGDATTLINLLNSADLTKDSLRKRVMQVLAVDGTLPGGGTVTGTKGVADLPTPTVAAESPPVIP